MGGQDEDLTSDATNATVREGPNAPVRERGDEYLEPGTQIGRYVVAERLGEGGMGIVYSARDPELDRIVALKLLTARRNGGERSQAWLLREAQALARLSHPNVVTVYDVGTLAEDRVFIAMEHVEGQTLRQWAKAGRPWREVVEVMRGAGAGLAAAHAVGLVHRDFKPENVIVGRDGRVRVMDFGLARLRTDEDASEEAPPPRRDSDLSIESRSPLSQSLTIAGEVYGTHGYMAPELFENTPADARTDQFSFGVALYELLYRKRPYDREEVAKVPRDKPLVPRPAPASDVPPELQKVAMRAIAPDPDARYASMDALLVDLAPPARSARAWIAGGIAIAAMGTGVLVYALSRPAGGPPPCEGLGTRFAGVWDANAKQRVVDAFTATKLPYAASEYQAVATALDRYTLEWTQTATDSCHATEVARSQTAEVASLRGACLEQRFDEMSALVDLLQKADGPLVDKADKAAAQLPPIARCSNVTALLAPDRPPPELVAKLGPVHAQIAAAAAAVYAGQTEPALGLTQKAVDGARAVGFDPVTAEAEYMRGQALFLSGKWDLAATAFGDAAWTAVRGKRDDVAGEAALSAAHVTAEGLGKPGEARIWLGLGTASLARLKDKRLELDQLEVAGIVAAASGDMKGAVAAHQQALVVAEQLYGRDPALWRTLYTLASTLAKSHAYTDATPYYERALKLRQDSAGADHPDIALILTSLGACYDHAGDAVKARAALEKALAIREHVFGPGSPRLIATLNNLADLLRKHGDVPAALAAITRAEEIAAKAPGTAHPLYHTVLTTLGEVQQAGGDLAAARASMDKAIELETAASSPMLPTTLTSRASLALAEKAIADAAGLADKAIAQLEASGGPTNPELWRPLAVLANARAAQKQPAAAKTAADRALAIADAAKLAEPELDQLRTLRASLP